MSALPRVLRELRPAPGRVALAVAAGAGATVAGAGLTGTSGWLIARAAQQPPVLTLMVAVVTVRALGIARGGLRYAERLAAHDVALRGVVTLRETLYRRLAAADAGLVAGLRRGDLLARVGADADAVADVVARGLLPFAAAAVTGLLAAGALALALPAAAAVLAGALLAAGVAVPLLAAAAAARAERDGAAARAAIAAEAHALAAHAAELRVGNAAPARLARLGALDRDLARSLERAARPAAAAELLSELAWGGAVAGSVWLGVSSPGLSPLMLPVVVLVTLAAAELTRPLPAAAVAVVRARSAAERIEELLSAPAAAAPAIRRGPEPAPSVHLRATGLACGRRAPVLTGLDLDLPPGSRVAVTGPSGSGKTTLLLTLAGLLPPVAGELSPGRDALRAAVTHVASDAHVFATTLRENLRVADPGAGDDRLVEALLAAGLGARWAALPGGLGTPLGPGGVALSGGETRRLLVARALLAPGGALLLDEPDEHLDDDGGADLVRALLAPGGPAGDRTVVVATHRPAALEAAATVLRLGAVGRDTKIFQGQL